VSGPSKHFGKVKSGEEVPRSEPALISEFFIAPLSERSEIPLAKSGKDWKIVSL